VLLQNGEAIESYAIILYCTSNLTEQTKKIVAMEYNKEAGRRKERVEADV
jgi:hypothetical protein